MHQCIEYSKIVQNEFQDKLSELFFNKVFYKNNLNSNLMKIIHFEIL
jgi:hypothetical protein